MKNVIKKVLVIIGILAVLSPSQMVNAQEIISAEIFDYEWYLEQHPDLAAITTDPATVYQFYLTVGLGADWNGRISPVYVTNETDLKCYGIVDSITNATMTQREKATAIHNWMCQNIQYDYSFSHYTVKGAIDEGLAVCQGYAETFEKLCKIAGIECEMVTGTVNPSIERKVNIDGRTVFIYAAGSGGHAWNQVKVDGQWYQVDVTWDDGYEQLTSKGYITEFFLITPENMMYDHTYNYPDRIHY